MERDKVKKAGVPRVRYLVDKNRQGSGYTITVVRQRKPNQVKISAIKGVGTVLSRQQERFGVNDLTEVEEEGKLPGRGAGTAGSSGTTQTEDKMTARNQHGGGRTSMTEQNVMGELAHLKGQVVIARDKDDGIYYEGVVVSCPNPRYATVKRYQDDKIFKLSTRFLLPIKGAISTPPLRVGDYVLVRVMNMTNESESYIPGIIQMPPKKKGPYYYTVLIYNSQAIVTMRRHLVKISKERFDFTVDYICQMLREENYIYGKKPPSPDPDIKIKGQKRLVPRSTLSRPCAQRPRVKREPVLTLDLPELATKKDKGTEDDSRRGSSSSSSDSPDNQPTPLSPKVKQRKKKKKRSKQGENKRSEYGEKQSRQRRESLSSDEEISPNSASRWSPVSSESSSQQRISERSTSRSSSPFMTIENEEKPARLRIKGNKTEKIRLDHDDHNRKGPMDGYDETQNDSDACSEQADCNPSSPISSVRGSASHRTGGITARLKEYEDRLKELLRQLQEQDEKHREEQEDIKRKIDGLRKEHRQKRHQDKKKDKRREDNTSMLDEFKEQTSVDTGTCRKSLALLEMRKSLASIREKEEVLARWPDEGWYYRGIIKVNCKDFSYMIMDSTGEVEQIWREDIITENDDASQVIKVDDKVIGLHPRYSFSYAPGKVTDTLSHLKVKVCFYDNQVAELQRDEVYKIPQVKYKHDVRELRKCETQWVGQAVVARDDNTGIYCIGCVLDKIANKHLYKIEWHDGTTSIQSPEHMLGAFTRRHKLAVGDRVLAVQDNETFDYLPGWIIGDESGQLKVRFCNGLYKSEVKPEESYWLSIDYFDKAVLYFNKRRERQQ